MIEKDSAPKKFGKFKDASKKIAQRRKQSYFERKEMQPGKIEPPQEQMTREPTLPLEPTLDLAPIVTEKPEEMISEKILEDKLEWPSELLATEMVELGIRETKYDFSLEDSYDVTYKSSELAEKFRPKIILEGMELKTEKEVSYAGLVWRCLEDNKGNNRAFQYIYIWTKQKLAVSPYYSTLPTFLLAMLGIAIISFIPITNPFLQAISVGMIGFGFMAVGILKLLTSIKSSKIYVHNEYMFVLWGSIFNILIAELFYKASKFEDDAPPFILFDQYFSIYKHHIIGHEGAINISIPIVSIVLLGISLFTLIMSIWQPDLPMASHSMDYAPVFVYAKREDENSEFKLQGIRYDAYHYFVEDAGADWLSAMGYIHKKNEKERPKLSIDNAWHSLVPSSGIRRRRSFISAITGIGSAIAIILSFTVPEDHFLSVFTASGPVIAFILLPIILFVSIFILFGKHPSNLDEKIELSDKKTHLTHEKLIALWNIKDDHAAFKIRRKMQAPFRNDDDFWSDFRDHVEEVLYLDVLPRLSQLEKEFRR